MCLAKAFAHNTEVDVSVLAVILPTFLQGLCVYLVSPQLS